MLNEGIAFGIWQGVPLVVIVAALIVIAVIALKTRELWERVGLGLMLSGGSLNFLQRLNLGYVIDPWSVGGLGYNNLADYLIFFGLVVYGYTYFVRGREYRRHR